MQLLWLYRFRGEFKNLLLEIWVLHTLSADLAFELQNESEQFASNLSQR